MKRIISFVSVIGLLSISQIVYSDSITDTYNTGDTLTATTLNNIKSAVNNNDTRTTTLENSQTVQDTNIGILDTGQQALQTNDATQDTRLDALEFNVNEPVLKKLVAVDSVGTVFGDFVTNNPVGSTGGISGKKIATDFHIYSIYKGFYWKLVANSNALQSGGTTHYDDVNCTGNAYREYRWSANLITGSPTPPVGSISAWISWGSDGNFYVYDPDSVPTTVFMQSEQGGETFCDNYADSGTSPRAVTDVVPAELFIYPSLVPPYFLEIR